MITLEVLNISEDSTTFRIAEQSAEAYDYGHTNPFVASNGVTIISAAIPQVKLRSAGYADGDIFFIRGDEPGHDLQQLCCKSWPDYERIKQAVDEFNCLFIPTTIVFNE